MYKVKSNFKVKELLIPFIIGGTVIAGVKFAATQIDNAPLAAIIGGVPTGLVSIYFLKSQKSIGYAHNYFYVTLILATAILTFYLLLIHTKMSKNTILLISLITWSCLVIARYIYASNTQNKK